ncbi:GTPase SAR1 related small G protein [Enterocytozoon bieneusi H348]|nr:GTPase SAR1 related small G protein [Enterocytozoon bieneusi H348]|eukprot:XP_002650253.1 GTPase SAR1 related small G protein [Enterocytozoon bieneusi H348]
MRKSYKIIFLGNTSVGKTMLIYRYISDGFTFPEPTIGIDFFSNTLDVDGTNVRLQLWDTAGQERYKSIITPYIRDSFLAVILYAINDRESFNQLKYWIDLYINKNNNKDSHILIVANKKDLWGENINNQENSDSSFVTDIEGKEFAQKYNAQFCTASALDKKDIKDVSNKIKEIILYDIKHNVNVENDEPNMLHAKKVNRWCC